MTPLRAASIADITEDFVEATYDEVDIPQRRYGGDGPSYLHVPKAGIEFVKDANR